MSPRKYILNEREIIERECRRRGITPSEWVLRYAQGYHQKYAHEALAPCFEGYK